MRKYAVLLFAFVAFLPIHSFAQQADASAIFYKVRTKMLQVKDYVADVKMKLDVSFMKVPVTSGKLYFKAPDKMKLERNGGVAILPKKNISLSLNNLVPEGNVTVLDAETEMVGKKKLHIVKVLPDNDQAGIILAKIWIDEDRLLAEKIETTTRDNGTVIMELEYGKYISLALPDKITVIMDVKDYKIPKSMTMDYDGQSDAEITAKAKAAKNKKGKIQITYQSYKVNTGLKDSFFLN